MLVESEFDFFEILLEGNKKAMLLNVISYSSQTTHTAQVGLFIQNKKYALNKKKNTNDEMSKERMRKLIFTNRSYNLKVK